MIYLIEISWFVYNKIYTEKNYFFYNIIYVNTDVRQNKKSNYRAEQNVASTMSFSLNGFVSNLFNMVSCQTRFKS